MWNYKKTERGYARVKSIASSERFIFDNLTNKENRSIWRKLIGFTWCKLFRHEESDICVQKGYNTKYGSYRLEICKNCYAGIVFCERKEEIKDE